MNTENMDVATEVANAKKKDENLYPLLNTDFLCPGDNFHVPVGRVHQIYAISDTELFEFSTHHEDSDSYRLIPGD